MDSATALFQAFNGIKSSGMDDAAGSVHGILQPNAGQVDRFQSLMGAQSADDSHAIVESHGVSTSNGGNLVSNAIESQDSMTRDAVSDITRLEQTGQSMSPDQFVADATRVSMEVAMTSANMQAKQGVVEASKGALQTLMKNS